MKALVLALLVCVTAATARAQPATPRSGEPPDDHHHQHHHQPPFIDVMTIGVGEVVFEKFGHAAICIRYQDVHRDPTCFNFGVSDFHEGATMVWSFLRGRQKFWVEQLTYAGMMAFYQAEDRDIFVQTLPLTAAQARTLEARLWASLAGPDSVYHYDHFDENCTTRIRDLVDHATGGKLAVGSDLGYPLTYRELGRRGFASAPPLVAIADFVFGRSLETHPTVWQAMFHPTIFRMVIEQRLGATPRQVYHRKGPAFVSDGPTGRLGILAIALLAALPIVVARLRGRLRVAPCVAYAGVLAYVLLELQPALWSAFGAYSLGVPLLFAAGLAGALHPRRGETLAVTWATLHLVLWGVFVWTLLLLSPTPSLQWNECGLAVIPTDIVLPFLRPSWRRNYARVRVALLLLASLLAAVGVLVQPLWVPILVAFLPLSVIAFEVPGARHDP